MGQSRRPSERPNRPVFALQKLEIMLANLSTNPGRMNPEFLRHNQIVEDDWNVRYPVLIEAGSSRIQYTNGLSLAADSDSVTISQRNPAPEIDPTFELDAIVAPEVARKYLQKMIATDYPYFGISIEPSGSMKVESSGPTDSQSPLEKIALQMPFDGTTPIAQARFHFNLDDRQLTIYVSESPQENDGFAYLRFSGEIHRFVEGDTLEEQTEFLEWVLGNWEQDMNDFKELAYKYHSLYVTEES